MLSVLFVRFLFVRLVGEKLIAIAKIQKTENNNNSMSNYYQSFLTI